MTYKQIYTNFLIEYDKADVSSSYPSLTNKEIAVLLDKAMYALIAQKVTGNNPRKLALDMDSKAMSDIAPLINNYKVYANDSLQDEDGPLAKNEMLFTFFDNPENISNFNTPDYIIDGVLKFGNGDVYTVKLVTSLIADKFKETVHNKPWIKEPIMYMSNFAKGSYEKEYDKKTETVNYDAKTIHLLFDSNLQLFSTDNTATLNVRGIQIPDSFENNQIKNTEFPLSNTMCEELINLAVVFACRTVQDPRLTAEIQTKSLEA